MTSDILVVVVAAAVKRGVVMVPIILHRWIAYAVFVNIWVSTTAVRFNDRGKKEPPGGTQSRIFLFVFTNSRRNFELFTHQT